MDTQQPYEIKWAEHQQTLTNSFFNCLVDTNFCDVTLCCEGNLIPCHKIVLSATSFYFQNIFKSNQFKDCRDRPVIVFNDINVVDMCAVLNYAYTGYVEVQQESLGSFLQAAYTLQMKGIMGSPAEGLQSILNQVKNPLQLQQRVVMSQQSKDNEPHSKQHQLLSSIVSQAQKDPPQSNPQPKSQEYIGPEPSTSANFLSFGPQEDKSSPLCSLPNLALPKFTITPINAKDHGFQDVTNLSSRENSFVASPRPHVAFKRPKRVPKHLEMFKMGKLKKGVGRPMKPKVEIEDDSNCVDDTADMPGGSKDEKSVNHGWRRGGNAKPKGDKAFCGICQKSFTSWYLQTHIKKMHQT